MKNPDDMSRNRTTTSGIMIHNAIDSPKKQDVKNKKDYYERMILYENTFDYTPSDIYLLFDFFS